MNLKALKYLMIALSVDILCVHWRIFYYLNPEVENKHPFSFLIIDEATVISLLFAIAFSIGTIIIIYYTNRRYLIIVFGALDALAIEIFYNIDIHIKFAAHYYCAYAFIIFLSMVFFKGPVSIEDKILSMKEVGKNQKDIANRLEISESKVSRVLKKLNNLPKNSKFEKEEA